METKTCIFISHNWVCVGQVNQLIRKLMPQMCEFCVHFQIQIPINFQDTFENNRINTISHRVLMVTLSSFNCSTFSSNHKKNIDF